MSEWNKNFWIAGSKGGTANNTRYPQDDPEGVIGQYDENNQLITTGAISLTKIETLDLFSEGRVQGLVSGTYKFVGNTGDIGYTSYEFTPYPTPNGITVNWLRSVYWNNVPLIDSDNKYNFSNIDVSYTVGLPNGSLVGTKNSELTVTRPLGERLRGPRRDDTGTVFGSQDDYTKTYRIYNNSCVAVFLNVKFGQLYRRNVTIGDQGEYGDVEITSVEYEVKYKPLYANGINSSWNAAPVKIKVEGKISYGYIKSSRIDFATDLSILSDKNFIGWEIQIKRLTEDSQDTTIVNQTTIDSLTEVYGSKFSYPNSALVRCNFNAEFFSQVPERAFHADLIQILIPSNYDPILRKYTGDWDGTFADQKQWSDNPAWCFYDLITNRRYGLGRFFDNTSIDKWTLYKIGQYCDQLVSDGFDGVEPRFSCNLYISSREEAIKVINDFASIFRGMVYYGGAGLKVAQDSFSSFEEVFIQFTNANVKDGDFNYTTAPRNTKNTIAIVRYNDKNNFYKPAIEYVENLESIKKYGIRETEVAAYGCTSRGQALRYGKWLLANDTETISFVAPAEAAMLKPGDIFRVNDSSRTLVSLGGRVKSYLDGATGAYLELDRNVTDIIATGTLTGNLYSFTLTTPTYVYDSDLVDIANSSQITKIRNPQIQKIQFTGINATELNSGYTRINFSSGFLLSGDYTKIDHSIWSIDLVSGSNVYSSGEYWRTINVEESDLTSFKVLGVRYNPEKYTIIDNTLTPTAPVTNPTINYVPGCPKDLNITFQQTMGPGGVIDNNYFKGEYILTWGVENTNNIDGFVIFQTKDQEFQDGDFINPGRLIPIGIPIGTAKQGDQYTYSIRASDYGYYRFAVFSYSAKLLATQTSTRGLSTCYVAGDVSLTAPEAPYYSVNIYGLVATDSGSGDSAEAPDTDPTKTTDTFTVASPYLSWDFIKNNVEDGRKTLFRATVREPSPTTKPSANWYAEYTGLFPDATVEGQKLTFIFPIEDNVKIIPPIATSPRGPYRDYDLIIEAHDEFGNSSAGGNFGFPEETDQTNGLVRTINNLGLRDSTFSQGKGYDIVRVTNSPITGASFNTTSLAHHFKASTFISPGDENGQILNMTLSGRYVYPDMQGILLFYSTGNNFTTGNIYNTLNNSIELQNMPFSGFVDLPIDTNPIDIGEWPVIFSSPAIFDPVAKSGWMRYLIYDSFDVGIKDQYDGNWKGFLTGHCDYSRCSKDGYNGQISGFRQKIGSEVSSVLSSNVMRPISFIEVSNGSGSYSLIPSYDRNMIINSGYSPSQDGVISIRGLAELRANTNYYDKKIFFLSYTGASIGDGASRNYEYYSGSPLIDNNDTVIKPANISIGTSGRYIKI